MYAHGCFRFDCPPYHEQSEYLLSIYVIPRLISNGRVATPPNLTCVKTQSMEFIVLYLHKSYFVFNSPECLRKKTFWSPSIGGPQSRSYDAGNKFLWAFGP